MAPRNGGTLGFRVDQVERNVSHIEKQVDAIRESMATRADIEKITASVTALAHQASSAGKPNWQAMTVVIGALGLIGTLVYWPINTALSDMKTAVHEITVVEVQQQQTLATINAQINAMDGRVTRFEKRSEQVK